MNDELSLYENLKALIKIEQDSGTSSLFSEFALTLLRTLEEQESVVKECSSALYKEWDDASRSGYTSAAGSAASSLWDLYSDFYHAIM